ncbi:hypothetical protein [Nonomuraea sp. NPDC049400]|uniref:hypothetical protein n=1 Tax=Nonomuraea sp. NPDC049400 TaxID=3364352 RepID=UPI0037B63721
MRSFIVGLAAAATLAGLPAGTASAASQSSLPTCAGERVAHQELYTEAGKSAYIHVFFDTRTATACAYLNSTNDTWGQRKHMTIMLKHCSRAGDGFGECIGQRKSVADRGWYTGRSNTVRLTLTHGCVLAWGRIWWEKNYGVTATKTVVCVNDDE